MNRFDKMVKKMEEKELTQLIITSAPDIFYFLGKWIHSGERMLSLYINIKGERKLIVNEIVTNTKEIEGVDVLAYKDGDDPIGMLAQLVDGSRPLGIDKNWPSHFLIELMEKVSAAKFVNSSSVVDEVRLIKDEGEIKRLSNASAVVDKVMADFVEMLPSRFTEKEGEDKLLKLFKKYGTNEFSFEPIIAYGANAANPHHVNSEAMPKEGDSIVIDIGGITENYCSDTTRTVFFGEPSEEAKKIYEIVKRANAAAVAMVKPGVKFSDVDETARKIIEEEGYGQYFTHRTGHCVGIEVHEPPSVSFDNDMELKPGMVFSVEPGIYIPGKYGVRIEDLVIVTEEGRKVLNSYSKDLTILKC